MNINDFLERFHLNLTFTPNNQQSAVMAALARFCSPLSPSESLFLLMGYAGTGKTSVISALVKTLRECRTPVILMAPTGRAAKVLSKMSGFKAQTIHRKIYREDEYGEWSGAVAYNPVRNGVFIVDEASMISMNDGTDSRFNVLDDLIEYVYSGDGCKMIFMGDSAQLPPVGYQSSPALNVEKLKSYGLRISRAVLTDVVRQGKKSGILLNATLIRKSLLVDPLPPLNIRISGFNDVKAIEGHDVQDFIESSYGEKGIDNTIIITRSNFRANLYNNAIRTRILGREEELCRGERLLVVKNNYLWGKGIKGLDFIANGEICIVENIYSVEEKYGMRFADVRLSLPDFDKELDCKILLDTLTSPGPSLNNTEIGNLYNQLLQDPNIYSDEASMSYRIRAIKGNEYLNALQVKYGYALTCHKAQGGQWQDVYVDAGQSEEETTTVDYYRWIYTAITRASEKLYLVNPTFNIS